MLFASSKRALSSTITATCLPRCAASMSAATIAVSPDVRYSVILIASTWSSRAASSRNRSTDAPNESNGWWTSRSRSRMTSKMLALGSRSSGGVAAMNGGSRSAGRSSVASAAQIAEVEQPPGVDDVALGRGGRSRQRRPRAAPRAAAREGAPACRPAPRRARPRRSGAGRPAPRSSPADLPALRPECRGPSSA